ncbi:hypothetical protein VTK73DRAFT_6569 [Phialemonium thermophilum]|uniref:RAVE subunit 2/Rogdi n=1 Tax=Phialemonium thermophilum TaxID=223376 RepID=A0ABR3WJ13_9PEZI
MSVEVWPLIPQADLRVAQETSRKRELDWLLEELHETLRDLKHGLEDCYALLAPVDPGSTLVLSTPRNEIVKGTVTRVGTRIVKGTIHLRLRTLPVQTLSLNPDHPIHLAPLTNLHAILTESLDLLGLTLSYCYSADPATAPLGRPLSNISPSESPISSPNFIAAQLRLLSQHFSEASTLLKGPPLTESDPSWTTCSASPSHFRPPLPLLPHPGTQSGLGTPPLSFYLGIQDGCLVLWLRSLEPADAPVNFGTKLALAIGTARRLEHDEADRVFGFCCEDSDDGDMKTKENESRDNNGDPRRRTSTGPIGQLRSQGSTADQSSPSLASLQSRGVEVFVREKVRVETADPSLLSLAAKMTALGHMLNLARRNLAAVMGEELED